LRLGSSPDRGVNDHWFCVENADASSPNSPLKVAHEVLALIESQGEPWWLEHKTRTANKL
jgi:hypothetical protein